MGIQLVIKTNYRKLFPSKGQMFNNARKKYTVNEVNVFQLKT